MTNANDNGNKARMVTRTAIFGNTLTAMLQVTCKLTVGNERLPELSW
jgi:hypothetical protein